MQKTYLIEALWDGKTKVWVANSDDVPGLCTEAPTMEKLMKKLDIMIPELLRANGLSARRKRIPFKLVGEMNSMLTLH